MSIIKEFFILVLKTIGILSLMVFGSLTLILIFTATLAENPTTFTKSLIPFTMSALLGTALILMAWNIEHGLGSDEVFVIAFALLVLVTIPFCSMTAVNFYLQGV